MRNFLIASMLVGGTILAYYFFAQNQSIEAPANRIQTPVVASAELKGATEPKKTLPLSASPHDATVEILEPENGAVVTSPIIVKFGIRNMSLAPAGINQDNSGHHHLLIDLDELPNMTLPLPASEQLIHFGGAQTETSIELSPGTHTLQLLLGNYLHIPHNQPVMSEKITITVQAQ